VCRQIADRAAVRICVLFVVLLLGRTAEAFPAFPDDIVQHLHGTAKPACSVCHLGGKTTNSTPITPLALALRARGFTGDVSSLYAALDLLASDGTDSDGDGVTDVEELRAGTDPNSPVPEAPSADPAYGCAIAPRPGGAAACAAAGTALLLLVLLRRRRRRTSNRNLTFPRRSRKVGGSNPLARQLNPRCLSQNLSAVIDTAGPARDHTDYKRPSMPP
jgi:hypothetical protein